MRIIHKSTPRNPSVAPEPAQTSLWRHLLGAVKGGPDRKSPGLHSPHGSPTPPSLLLNKRFAFPMLALLAALAVGLLFLLPGGALYAQETSGAFYYHEKGTGPVVTLSASDPERVTPIVWSLPGPGADPDGTDGDLTAEDAQDNLDFKINPAGELSFRTSPNYEAPADEGMNNTYNAVVQASDGGVTTWVEYFKVTVTVLDVEEKGKVEWTVDPDGSGTELAAQDLLEFQAGAVLTAAVTDPDGGVSITTWRWYRSSSMSAMGTLITDEDGNPEDGRILHRVG